METSPSDSSTPSKPPVVDYRGPEQVPKPAAGRPLERYFGFWSIWCSVVALLLLWAAYETRKGRLLPKSNAAEALAGWATVLLIVSIVTNVLGFKFDDQSGLAGWGCLTILALLVAWIATAVGALAGFGRYG
jgi:hypothetical protein